MSGIDFQYCGIGSTEVRSLTLTNPHAQPVRFEIQTDSSCPFELTPKQGYLTSKQSQNIQISYTPVEARVHIATAIFKFTEGEECSKTLKMSAIGKYPFLILNQDKIDFEELLVGKVDAKSLLLKNNSTVAAKFAIEKVSDDGKDVAFSLEQYDGMIPPGGVFEITVKYIPSIVGSISCTRYSIKTVGGNQLTFSCTGEATGFKVGLSSQSIHFGEVQHGSTTNRLLNIVNASDLPTTFQFITDKKNVFSFSKVEGTVNANSSFRIIVTFTPNSTTNFYERVFCLVR